MLNEKPNNDFHWKNKLQDVESLSGETFNKEAAWEKLHERMQGKSRNKKAVWYWAAAACLLLALIIPWLFVANKKESELVKNNSVQKQIQPSSSHLLPAINKQTTAVISSQSNEKKLPALSIEKSNKINSLVNHNKIPLKIVRDKKEKEEFITQKITNNAVVPVNTAISIVALLPEKKKLKVVHINELGDPVAEAPIIARNYEHRSFQIKLINQEVYTSPPPSSGNTGFNIFKTKNVPSN
jgi:hypothetical protein